MSDLRSERLPKQISDEDALKQLQAEINRHRQEDRRQGTLASAMNFVWEHSLAKGPSLKSLETLHAQAREELKTADQDGAQKIKQSLVEAIKADKTALETRDTFAHCASGFLKTTGLFLRGKVGLAATVGFYALDEMHLGVGWKTQAAELALGSTKGLGMRAVFRLCGESPATPALKGAILGGSNTFLDTALSLRSYRGSDGELRLANGWKTAMDASFDYKARCFDGAVFLTGHALFQGGNRLALNALKESQIASNMFSGATFGLSTGAAGEYQRQKYMGEDLDLGKIARQALLQGSLDTLASALGHAGSNRRAERSNGLVRRPAMERSAETKAMRAAIETNETTDTTHDIELRWQRPDLNLAQLADRLTARQEKIRLDVSNESAPSHFDNVFQFLRSGLKTVEVPAIVYTVSGHSAEIVVPEAYAQKLDAVRLLRIASQQNSGGAGMSRQEASLKLAEHPLRNRVLAEDLIIHLDDLPNRHLVSSMLKPGADALTTQAQRRGRYILLDHENPEDAYNRLRYKDLYKDSKEPFRSYAAADRQGDIWFFQAEDNGSLYSPLRRAIFHEYSHILKWSQPELSNWFDLACKVDKRSASKCPRAKADSEERWAVDMSERVLSPDSDDFIIGSYYAPVRMSVLSFAAEQALTSVKAGDRAKNHEVYLDRLQKSRSDLLDRACEKLNKLLKDNNTNAEERQAALQLLQFFSKCRPVESAKPR